MRWPHRKPRANVTSTPPDPEPVDGDPPAAPAKQEIIERLVPFLQPGSEEKAADVVRTMLIAQSHIGPLPPSREFAGYEQALPGAADRVLRMAESEQEHRDALE